MWKIKKIKKMIALLLAGVLLLTGCGGGAAKYGPVNKNGQQGVSKDGKLHLTFYFPVQVGGETAKLIENICNDFSKEHEDIVVDPIYTGNREEYENERQTSAGYTAERWHCCEDYFCYCLEGTGNI